MGSSSGVDNVDELEDEGVETDSTGRYVRFEEVLGEGVFKKDYKGFDELKGIEITWSKVELSEKIFESEECQKNVSAEVSLLKSLKHENIMRCYHSWVDSETKTVNIITELSTSGTMSQYRKKHNLVDKKAIKNWARQILKGLDYLHCQNPPIIHGDLSCDNIFVNGYSGKVRIGDVGLAAMLQEDTTARAASGKPEFMAPELFREEYDHLVDIYSFGMCLLQMVTRELPYTECSNSDQVHRKVRSGIKPAILSRVTDLQLKLFIEKCLGPASERPSAINLLNDPFLALVTDSGLSAASRTPSLKSESVCSSSVTWDQVPSPPDTSSYKSCDHVASSPVVSLVGPLKAVVSENIECKLEGQLIKEIDYISMVLRIGDKRGHAQKIEFVFSIKKDTVHLVVQEMMKELQLSVREAVLVTELMENLVRKLVNPEAESSSSENNVSQPNEPAKPPSDTNQDAQLLASKKLSEHDRAGKSRLANSTGQDKQVTGSREGNKKEVAKTSSRSLKKLLFFCGNKF
ncbi:probable serine/threonine-protein kinase WNK11 [Chenopodium quinoa]|uniref:non-specific serine/threonine protein kinase n=1 Tax=Chenopodium quinoa TaxID=63459 RepID=A0A803MCG6_CHEQI|nr:probable serine/threonine-protein kinase WNK11 [Chenopodium quinoa]XP_021775211.1 probable serine/threonine-protein kinase WNK11 [Chenopodium quinoa]